MRNAIVVSAMFAVAACLAFRALAADDAGDDKPKYSIKEVMKNAHAGKEALVKKAIAGDTSDADEKKLLEMYEALSKNEPPKGDADSWNTKTEALVVAVQAIVDGDDEGRTKLKTASNCGACHGAHKPKN